MKQVQRMIYTWGENGLMLSKYAHPGNEQRGMVKQMKDLFMAIPEAVCWWCGMRPAEIGRGGIQADHIAPFMYWSPMAIACRTCNKDRKRVLPHPERTGRLFFSDDVIRSVPAPHMLAWCQARAEEIFGGYIHGVQILLAQGCSPKPVRNEKGKICEASNRMIGKVGFRPPSDDVGSG